MTFRDKLVKLEACRESLEWVKGKTIKQAWETCEDSQWMIWILTKTDLDLIDPICDMAEKVLHLVPEESQLACIWAISATRRRASKDELYAAAEAAADAVDATNSNASCNAASSAYNAASYAYTCTYYAHTYASNCISASASARGSDAYRKEQKKQCDILRKYFTIDQVRKAFDKLVA